jgi:non-heme chloroperoxidase
VLSVVGSHDFFTVPGIGETAAALARDGTLVRFEGCGHAPQIEETEGYLRAVCEFLDRIG